MALEPLQRRQVLLGPPLRPVHVMALLIRHQHNDVRRLREVDQGSGDGLGRPGCAARPTLLQVQLLSAASCAASLSPALRLRRRTSHHPHRCSCRRCWQSRPFACTWPLAILPIRMPSVAMQPGRSRTDVSVYKGGGGVGKSGSSYAPRMLDLASPFCSFAQRCPT
jgi:hypothetical protein